MPSWDDNTLIGLTRVNEHCTFTWKQASPSEPKMILVKSWHCDDCVEEARQLGFEVLEAEQDTD
jgi:hypothetical protein